MSTRSASACNNVIHSKIPSQNKKLRAVDHARAQKTKAGGALSIQSQQSLQY